MRWPWDKPREVKVPKHLTLDQLRQLGEESNRYIEVFYPDGVVLRIWEPGRKPQDPESGKYW